MPDQLMLVGAILLAIALIGGGLSAAGIEIPIVQSRVMRSLLAVIGLGLLGAGAYQLFNPPRPPGIEPPPAGPVVESPAPSNSATVNGDVDCKTTAPGSPCIIGSKVGDVDIKTEGNK